MTKPKRKAALGTVCGHGFPGHTDFERSIWGEIRIEEILWFQVAVDHSVGMQILQGERVRKLCENPSPSLATKQHRNAVKGTERGAPGDGSDPASSAPWSAVATVINAS